jgi:hypothetical protein
MDMIFGKLATGIHFQKQSIWNMPFVCRSAISIKAILEIAAIMIIFSHWQKALQ